MKKSLIVVTVLTLLLSSCAGHYTDDVCIKRYGEGSYVTYRGSGAYACADPDGNIKAYPRQ
jgi:hypothetical protein